MPSPTTATLSGPTSGECSIVSSVFTVTLDQPADAGGVAVTVGNSVGGDTLTSSPFTIPAGSTVHTFSLTPVSCGNRDISITTAPVLGIVSSPITYNALCACPDDTGTNSQTLTWGTNALTCPAAFSLSVSVTPSALEAKTLYCGSSPMSMTFTE